MFPPYVPVRMCVQVLVLKFLRVKSQVRMLAVTSRSGGVSLAVHSCGSILAQSERLGCDVTGASPGLSRLVLCSARLCSVPSAAVDSHLHCKINVLKLMGRILLFECTVSY